MIVGKRLKELREKNKLTQEELGKILNLNKSTISHYENDSRTPDLEKLERFANFYNVDINYIVGLDNNCSSEKRSVKISDEELELILEMRKIKNYNKVLSDPKRYAKLLDISIPKGIKKEKNK